MMDSRIVKQIFCVVAVVGLSLIAATPAAASTGGKPFGIAKFSMEATERTAEVETPLGSGTYRFVNEPYASPFVQAGGHPWGLTTTAELITEEFENSAKERIVVPAREARDLVGNLPPGLLGNPTAAPRCPLSNVIDGVKCPADTQIGVATIKFLDGKEQLGPILNVVPEVGQSAEFAIELAAKFNPLLTAHLIRTESGYGFSVVSNEIPNVGLFGFELTFWGVPADPSHDPMRGRFCGNFRLGEPLQCLFGAGGEHAGIVPVPFLTLPADCAAGPETATLRADSWDKPGHVLANGRYEGYVEATTTMPAVTGCDLLQFNPSIEVRPDTLLADEPAGLAVNVGVPQVEKPGVTATPQLRDGVVTLPEGMSVSPGVVDGIRACDESGPEGINFTGPESEEVGLNGELQLAAGHCPDASSLGTAEAITPLLPVPVKGNIYLAKPGCGGSGQAECTERDALDGNLYQLYLELGGTGELADTGVHIKVAGKTFANPATGQLTTVFRDNPQAPFSELKIHLNGGPRAPIDNPAVCGPAVTTADFTPWSAPGQTPEGLVTAGTPDATPTSFFDVMGCSSPPGLNPSVLAGTANSDAGQFAPFTLNVSRKDREQYVKGVQVRTPPGLLGMLSSVPLCGAAEAESGTCSDASKIGTTRVASGAGSHPFEIEGAVYLTGPYRGAPFGLSIVTHAVAGPFNLGLVVVRARIEVNRETSTLKVTTDESGPHAIPQIIFGVPLRLQRITVNIDRPNFMFNPTSCAPQQITVVIAGNQNAISTTAVPFTAGACRDLVFKPKFSVTTSGHTNRSNGASLDAKLSFPSSSQGSQADVARVKVSLPKQLPSRLTTLQQACPAATFISNPAGCPRGSVVGVVRAATPLLPVQLSGPVYFVSHGGEAFPSLIIVLQGDGVRVDLTGTTFISKAGITSSTFKTVPDVPVKSFELYLPQGRGSALAANGNLCKSAKKLLMPTTFVAQNGAQLKQATKISVTGCARKVASKARHRAKQSSRRKQAGRSGGWVENHGGNRR
jgi:hypothetical protein